MKSPIKIEFRLVETLKEYPGNPREMSQKDIDCLKRSLQEFGVVEPLVVNKKGEVIGGNQRLKVLKELGVEKVECVVVDLPRNKEKALNLALNKIKGDWEFLKLKDFLEDLTEEDIPLTGFSFDEVNAFLEDFGDLEAEEYGEPTEIKETEKDEEVILIEILKKDKDRVVSFLKKEKLIFTIRK